MIEFFYYFDYLRSDELDLQSSSDSKVHLIEHAKVFAIAIKYQADGLLELAVTRFKESMAIHWDHEDFAHAVHIVYHSTADDVMDLRTIVADTIHAHFDQLGARRRSRQ
jgi:hypothetical protein